MKKESVYFCLWYGPQYRFAYGVMTRRQLSITWLEKLGMCDLKYTEAQSMWYEVAALQGWHDIEGLAMTIVSDELYEANMQALAQRKA